MEQSSFPVQYDYPVSDYYRNHILNAYNLAKTDKWWAAVLLIRDPKTSRPFIALYQWQRNETGWKTQKRFTFKRATEVKRVSQVMQEFMRELD
ncbi:MAG: hypothetical protein JW893_04155 [Candidatus Omnitrophica bacterium]|nr:hypothetical protein [Candidatus Omnitrophota bacterium]